jgi:VIT1/CCC1 family predicted Fe2+/Mn2+ transporter
MAKRQARSDRSDRKSWLTAVLLAGLGVAVIAAPFVAGLHTMWVALAVTIGAALLVGAIGVVSGTKRGEAVIFRRGG